MWIAAGTRGLLRVNRHGVSQRTRRGRALACRGDHGVRRSRAATSGSARTRASNAGGTACSPPTRPGRACRPTRSAPSMSIRRGRTWFAPVGWRLVLDARWSGRACRLGRSGPRRRLLDCRCRRRRMGGPTARRTDALPRPDDEVTVDRFDAGRRPGAEQRLCGARARAMAPSGPGP